LFFAFSCTTEPAEDQQTNEISMQSDFDAPPSAAVKPDTFTEHGYTRVDSYFWLKEKENPEVIDYLHHVLFAL